MFDFDPRPIFILALLGLTLGMWKLFEIVVWLFQHVHISFAPVLS